jgi:GWxTD domain-containing protein
VRAILALFISTLCFCACVTAQLSPAVLLYQQLADGKYTYVVLGTAKATLIDSAVFRITSEPSLPYMLAASVVKKQDNTIELHAKDLIPRANSIQVTCFEKGDVLLDETFEKPFASPCQYMHSIYCSTLQNEVLAGYANAYVDTAVLHWQIDKNLFRCTALNVTVLAFKQYQSYEYLVLGQRPVQSPNTDCALPILLQSLVSGNYTLEIILSNGDSVIERNVYPFQKSISHRYVEQSYMRVGAADTKLLAQGAESSWIFKYSKAQLLKASLAMTPLLSKLEIGVINDLAASPSDTFLRRFMYNFWAAKNPRDPEVAWKDYAKKLNYVARTWGNSGSNGYETDRGRIYLKYGEPIQIEKIPNEKDALPYEIWIYPRLELTDDVYFIFFQQGRMAGDYTLLHCNLPGERYTQNWRNTLFRDPVDESHRIYEWINKGAR